MKPDGKVKWSKGDADWLPYRFEEALSVSPFANAQNAQAAIAPSPSFANAQGNQWLLVVEGENCVETARTLGLAAITWQGSSWTEAEILPPLQRIKDSGYHGIVKFRDNDGEGEEKAKKLEGLGSKSGLEVIVLDPKAIWSEMPEKGDIVDWVQWGQAQGMKPEDFIKRLEQESQALLTERSVQKPSQPKASKPTETERLKLEIQAYLQSPDIFDKVRMKGQICSSYRISSQDFTLLCQALEKQNSTPLPNSFDFSSFMEMGTDALEWIVPGILPKGETVLLAAQAKCGKTLLATDIAYAVLSGGEVLGEQVGVKGRVLLISSDESQNSTRRRLKARGFDLLPESGNLRIMTSLDISDLSPLEKELEDFRPHLVIIDSLTSITRESGLNEKDAEFARPLYKLKDLLGRYGAAGILIHHQNKDKEAKGIDKVSGSARIVAAVWGIWQIVAKDPNNEQDTIRWLKVKPREGEAVTLSLGINPKDTWASAGIFSFIGEFGDESGVKRTQGEKVMELLRKFSPKGLEYQEIDNFLGIGKSLYTVLDRLEDRQMICKRRSAIDQRRWVYCLPEHTTDELCTTTVELKVEGDSPPPTQFPSGVEIMAESIDNTSIEVSQQLFNTESTTIQHPDPVEHSENGYKSDSTINVADQKISQQLPKKKGEREVVKPSTPNGVLHNPVQGERGEGESEVSSSPTPSPDQRDEDVFEIGDRVRDIINGFKGTVVGFKDDRVVFDTYEPGRCSRPADLLFKLK